MLENKDKKYSIIKDIAIIVIGVVLIWFAVKVVFNVDNPFYVVSSGSMIPVLNVGDILIVKDGNTFNSLKVGDIIVFNRPQGGDRVIVHRIIEVNDRFGEKVIVTKGDANDGIIPGTDFPIREKDYIGSVAYTVPKVGLVLKYLNPPVNYIIIAGIIGILIYTNMKKKNEEKGKIDGKDPL
ncbi:MAG: signal peptidase I [Nitrososphaeraceae archaeon]|nr:signal peptidase I [Nitrososphaeraceae archaeon]MDW3604245.1 signal peptidase I [Nitrososphaeraceae archaeon]MDW3611626.1 signal peptidase I [Nitrososphaeraceae archaeon]